MGIEKQFKLEYTFVVIIPFRVIGNVPANMYIPIGIEENMYSHLVFIFSPLFCTIS